MVKGVIDEVKKNILLSLHFQQYRDIWISEDNLFNVLKENYHYCGEKRNIKRAMSSLKTDYPSYFNINTRNISKKRVTFYYVSTDATIPDVSGFSQSDWESIHQIKRITRVAKMNRCEHGIIGQPIHSPSPTSKSSLTIKNCPVGTGVPDFAKNYLPLCQNIISPQKQELLKKSTMKASSVEVITPSPKKTHCSKLFTVPRGSVVNVTNLNVYNNDVIINNYFESTEMKKLFYPEEG